MNKPLKALGLTRYMLGAVAAFGLLTFSAVAQAPLDIRVALVIGNSAYANANPLANPANDARAMGDTLRGLGFTVIELRDGQKAQMAEAIAKVGAALKGKQGVGMLYYAGHGLQLDWRNYMVPVDARLDKAADVPAQAIDVNSVIDAFKAAGNRMNILVLDACRDNPFAGTSSGKGLAPLDAPTGTFLAYATAPGNVADDGDVVNGNGLYTRFLLEELKKPTTRIEDVFKRVRLQVRQSSKGRQIPWESTSLEDDFFFNTGKVMAMARPNDRERVVAFNQEKADWDKIKDSKQAEDFYSFLQKYPSGYISEQAQFKVEQLQKAQIVAVPNRDGVVPLSPTARRGKLGDELVIDVIDEFTKKRRRTTFKVTYADDSRYELNDGVEIYDQSGSVLKSRTGTKSPGVLIAPTDMAIGKQWRSAFTNLRPDGVLATTFWEYRATGYDTITVPAGTFKAFVIVGRGAATFPGGYTTLESRSWFDPATLQRLRHDNIDRDRYGTIGRYQSLELVSFKRQPG